MIIDDEPWIIDGIKKTIQWEKEGYTIVGDALDAYEGMEKIKVLQPDVVMVDIRMPEISGLEMIRRMGSDGSEIEFIIVSGFDEFSYAKEGISLGIFEYILKPICSEELIKVLCKLKVRLSSKRKNAYKDNLEIIEQLAQDGNDHNTIKYLLNQLGISQFDTLKRIAFARIEEQEFFTNSFEIGGVGIAFIPVGTNNYFMTINYTEIDQSDLCELLMIHIKGLQIAGIGREIEQLEKINIFIQEAEIAAANEFVFGTPNVFLYSKPEYTSVREVVKSIINGISNNGYPFLNLEGVSIKDLLIEHRWGIEELCFIYNNILYYMMNDSEKEAVEPAGFISIETIKNEFKSFKDFESFFINTLCNTAENKLENSLIKYNKTVKEIAAYLDNYFSNEIRLLDISDMFFINPNYLSMLFKKTTGKTFSQYLTDIRMRKAYEMLSRTELSIEEVSSSVGYTDYYSFIKAFKKAHGITPGKFKKGIG